MNRRGFSFIELLVVITIIGILANIAIPIIRGVKVKAQATQVVGDISVIRTGVYDYYAAHQMFPQSAGWGRVPRGLEPSLPGGFTFRRGSTMYRWVRMNARQTQRTGRLGVIRARIRDADLLAAVKGSYRGDWIFGSGNQLIVYLN